jgi:hypothetical protein
MSTTKSTVAAEVEPVAASELAAAASDVAASLAAAGGREDVLTLELTDLVSDSNGEIVLFNDSHLPHLAVRAESPPVESGELGSHVTAAGDDVSGYRYVAFNDGTKLIFQDSVDLVILGTNGDVHA